LKGRKEKMALSPDNFKDPNFVLEYVGSSNRNELNDKLRDDNVTVDSLQVVVMLCGELRKLQNASAVNESAQTAASNAVSEAETERETQKANKEEADRISSGGIFGAAS
jgi:septum formation inhibitor MinC